MQAETIATAAPAKINLYLHVTGRRADGYHELDSLVAFADVGDRVEAVAAEQLSLHISGPFASALNVGVDNLVMRAAEALRAHMGIGDGAALRLEKNLPVASGIGGGSADAAATIKVLARLWGMHPGRHDLSGLALGLALELGADVPVCLAGSATYMSGIGEVLEPVSGLPDLPAVLVNPGVAVSTPAVFAARQGGFSKPGRIDPPPGDIEGWIAALRARRNDLAAPAQTLTPEIGAVLAALEQTPGCGLARMSGSGATCFGLYGDAVDAAAAAAVIERARPDWWVSATTFKGSAS